MIERYTRKEMALIWSDRNRFKLWLEIELAVCEELAKQKVIPPAEWRKLKKGCDAILKKGGLDPKRILFHEKKVKHDVIAFTTALAEKVGDSARYVHYGLTSSDVIDTATSLQIQQAGKILVFEMGRLLRALKKQAKKYEKLGTIGRSHGISAEPSSFGLKFLGWYAEMARNLERLTQSLDRMNTGQLSGAVGVNPHWGVAFETRVLKRLGLKRELVSTQVIPRDHHAEFLNVLALCGGALERISVELRHLQRSEVAELHEGFSKGQKGSSAMPHKKNPISSENLTGCARLLRSYAAAGLENIALWHERDISHSSVERIALPDATILLDYALNRMTGVIECLVVDSKRVKENLRSAGPMVYSGHLLLALVKAGADRENAYYWVQECAHRHLKTGEDFLVLAEQHPKISKKVPPREIRKIGQIEHQLRHVKQIYRSLLADR